MLIPNSSAPIQKKKKGQFVRGEKFLGVQKSEARERESEEEKRRSFDGAISLKTIKNNCYSANSRCAFPAAPAAPAGRW